MAKRRRNWQLAQARLIRKRLRIRSMSGVLKRKRSEHSAIAGTQDTIIRITEPYAKLRLRLQLRRPPFAVRWKPRGVVQCRTVYAPIATLETQQLRDMREHGAISIYNQEKFSSLRLHPVLPVKILAFGLVNSAERSKPMFSKIPSLVARLATKALSCGDGG